MILRTSCSGGGGSCLLSILIPELLILAITAVEGALKSNPCYFFAYMQQSIGIFEQILHFVECSKSHLFATFCQDIPTFDNIVLITSLPLTLQPCLSNSIDIIVTSNL